MFAVKKPCTCLVPFKCYVMQWGVGGGQISKKRALRRCPFDIYLSARVVILITG